MIVGLISDTHGLLRPEAVEAMRGSDHIIHAGDIGGPEILASLSELAPVTSVRGNIDTASWAQAIPERVTISLGALRITVLHDLADWVDGVPCDIVVSGHSHRPLIRRDGATLFVNPGSAGRRRFSLPVSAGRLFVTTEGSRAEVLTLV